MELRVRLSIKYKMSICIKIHKSYRNVVAIADGDLIGKKFEEGKRQLDIRENFYKNQEMNEEQAMKIIKTQFVEDSTFNIVGEESIRLAIKSGIIFQETVDYIDNIPFALKLL